MNSESLAILKSAEKTNLKTAYLKVVGNVNPLYYFLYNPSEYSDSYSATYSTVAALVAPVPYYDYTSSSGVTREFSDLILDTYEDRRSLKEIINGLKKLMMADVGNGEYEPPDLEFYWGSEVLKPVKLVDFNYRIDAVLGGEPAKGTMSLVFKEVPVLDPAKAITDPSSISTEFTSNSNPTEEVLVTKNRARKANLNYPEQINLTDRQILEGLFDVKQYLSKNINRYPNNIQKLIKSKNYDLDILIDGKVVLKRKGSSITIQELGLYTGRKFLPL